MEYRVWTETEKQSDRLAKRLSETLGGTVSWWHEDGFDMVLEDATSERRTEFEKIVDNFSVREDVVVGGVPVTRRRNVAFCRKH